MPLGKSIQDGWFSFLGQVEGVMLLEAQIQMGSDGY